MAQAVALVFDHISLDDEELQQQATVPSWVDPPAMASLILSVANGVAFQTRLDPRGPDQVAMAGQFAMLLLSVQQEG